jgi:predicted AlkP superfamily pyrophosphatase or phosphodiesterase
MTKRAALAAPGAICYKGRVTRPATLVMLSIDGLRAAALDDPTLELPALRGLAARGARAAALRPVFPTVTWPCHSTIVTGVSPARHGVLGNLVFDRTTGRPVEHFGDRTTTPIAAGTLWDLIQAAGGRTAAICWPKTRGVAAVADNIPEFYEQELFEAHASRPLWTELARRRLPVDRYGPWSASHPMGPMQDWLTLEAARHVLAARRPRLLLLHFLTLDSFQHDHGVESPEARWALLQMDALLGRLLTTLDELGQAESTTLMVLGDHGFVDVDTTHHLNQILRDERLLDVDRHGTISRRLAWAAGNGGAAHVYVLDGAARSTVDRLRERFAALPGVDVLGPERFRELGMPEPRPDSMQGDLMLAAADGVFFTGHPTPEAAAAAPVYRAAHGHAPSLAKLAAGLVLAGPGIRAGARPREVSMLDLAPTAARLLGLSLPGAEGTPLLEALEDDLHAPSPCQ